MRLRANLEPRWFLFITFFTAGIFFGGLTMYLYSSISIDVGARKIHPPSRLYKYINPLLAVDIYQNEHFAQNKSLELSIQGLVDANKKTKSITDMSVYFRDIEPGLWVAINENGKFSPGKLLKIPIMIAYYKLAEQDPNLLTETLVFNGPNVAGKEIFKPADTLKAGESYTIEALIERMIVHFDDDATNLLFDNIDKNTLNEIFSDLGIDFKEEKNTQDFISLKLYSLFFRILYNSSYLNREYSEKALELLVETPNDIGLGMTIPQSIPFANREGGRLVTNNGKKIYEVYDCGVFYYPLHPYILCATATGEDLGKIENVLKLLGERVYTEVKYQYPSS